MKKATLITMLILMITMLMAACNNYVEEDMPNQQPELPPQQISPLGRQVTEDFLSEFPSIFQSHRGWRDLETGAMYAQNREQWHLGSVADIDPENIPRVFICGTYFRWNDEVSGFIASDEAKFYDRDGNIVTEAPFLHEWGAALAESFALYDLDSNGIPEIIIDFVVWPSVEMGWTEAVVLYKFIDGAFRVMGNLQGAYRFFLDPDGQLILHYSDDYWGMHFYDYLRFTSQGMELEHIISPQEESDYESWRVHHRGEDFWNNPTPIMYGTGIQLTRIPPLTDLQEEIAESLRNR